MASLEEIHKLVTDIRIEQGVQGAELNAVSLTSRDTNTRVGKVEQDVAVLKDARNRDASTEETKVLKAIEKSDDRKGSRAIWIAVITGISALLMQMVGCFQSVLQSGP